MKKSVKITFGIVITIVALLAALVIIGTIQQNNVNNRPESARLPIIGVQEMQDILNDTSGRRFFVYVGRTSCPACQQFEPVFDEFLEEMDQSVPYFELDRVREEFPDEVRVINAQLGLERVPSLVFIQDGEVTLIEGSEFLRRNSDETKENLREFFNSHGGL